VLLTRVATHGDAWEVIEDYHAFGRFICLKKNIEPRLERIGAGVFFKPETKPERHGGGAINIETREKLLEASRMTPALPKGLVQSVIANGSQTQVAAYLWRAFI